VILKGTAVVIDRDNVDTDTLYPGAYLNIDDPEEMKRHLFEGLDPSLREGLGGDTILVVGENFGSGSSREHVVQGMKAWNIKCVLGKSFARIFHRNCVNLGLPVLSQPEAVAAAKPGARIEIDTDKGEIEVDGERFKTDPIPAFMTDMISSGGLIPWARERLAGRTEIERA
jgi:3-isopropylmalate/(R)-2-methylmalate dehydratase small subunit